jgi:hypothetical protein
LGHPLDLKTSLGRRHTTGPKDILEMSPGEKKNKRGAGKLVRFEGQLGLKT